MKTKFILIFVILCLIFLLNIINKKYQQNNVLVKYTNVDPFFIQVPVFNNRESGTIYGDVLSHSNDIFGDQHGRSTNVHETVHSIHSWIRNKYVKELRKKVNGFYCLNGNGCFVEEPKIRKSDIKKYLPSSVRFYRYDLYIQGQTAWDDHPLYIYDEWTAYVLGGLSAVEDFHNGKQVYSYDLVNVNNPNWTDAVSGSLEFSIYSLALVKAVSELDKEYWETNVQFRHFTSFMLQKAYEAYVSGYKLDNFKWEKQDKLLDNFLNSSDCKHLREIGKILGIEKNWLTIK